MAAISCQKQNDMEPLDYSVQTIPDIGIIFHNHYDLINVMDSMGQLHFGDNPPKLYTIDTTDGHHDTLGFSGKNLICKIYIPSNPNLQFANGHSDPLWPNQYLFSNQHKGVSSILYKSPKFDLGPDNHYIETASRHDSVFIMGKDPFFTVYYYQDIRVNRVENGHIKPDPKPRQAVILSGEVTNDGIKDIYIGIKYYDYANAEDADFKPGKNGFNINDIVVYYKDLMPFTYWDPNQTYDD